MAVGDEVPEAWSEAERVNSTFFTSGVGGVLPDLVLGSEIVRNDSRPSRSFAVASRGGGTASTAVWRGPYSHVTSESLSLRKAKAEQTKKCASGQTHAHPVNVLSKNTAADYRESETDQLSVSGETVLRFPRCLAHVRQDAFSSRTPLAISVLCLVMAFHEVQTSSSAQSCDR